MARKLKKEQEQSQKKLNNMQEKFVREYVIDYNATQAAVRAGYSPKSAKTTASRMLTYDNVLARVRELQAEAAKRQAISEDKVILALWEVYKRCMTAVPVMEYDRGSGQMVETGEYTFDSKGALRALELVGKHLGMFKDKMELSQTAPIIVDDIGNQSG